MLHRAWSSIVEVPYYFLRSYVKFEGHTVLKIVEFDPNWAFLDCNSSLNSPMAMKCCTKLETAKEICPIVFQGHPSNFKVTRYKTSPILTQIGRFRTIGQSQLSNPSDLPCLNYHRLFYYISVSVFSFIHRPTSYFCKSSSNTRKQCFICWWKGCPIPRITSWHLRGVCYNGPLWGESCKGPAMLKFDLFIILNDLLNNEWNCHNLVDGHSTLWSSCVGAALPLEWYNFVTWVANMFCKYRLCSQSINMMAQKVSRKLQ